MKKYILPLVILLAIGLVTVRMLTKKNMTLSFSKGESFPKLSNSSSLKRDFQKVVINNPPENTLPEISATKLTIMAQKNEVENSCSAVLILNKNQNALNFLNEINDLNTDDLGSCTHYLKENFIGFNDKACLSDIENYRQTGQRGNVFKTCAKMIGLKSWLNYKKNLAAKPLQSMTKEELAEAYHGVLFDLSVAPERRLKIATRYAAELLKRTPEDKYAMNMLIRTSMIDNETGSGYSETFAWIKRASRKQPNEFALVNHIVQRLSYAGNNGLTEVKKILEVAPDLLAAQIVYAENKFNNPQDLINYYKANMTRFPQNSVKYNEIIAHIKKNENYFFRVVDLSLDTVPDYM